MSKKIVIVEDDKPIAQMYEIKFVHAGYEVSIAENGLEGLVIIEKTKPDAVLLDLMMPEMGGEEMLKKLRSTEWGKNTKVVILTNVSEEEVAKKISSYNISGFIIKAQYTPAQVVEKISNILK